MTEETFGLLLDVAERVEHAVRSRDCPAIAALEGERQLTLTDYDYLRDDDAAKEFELNAAARGKQIGAIRWVIAVPQVWVITSGEISTRAVSNHALRPGEEEAITWMSYDASDGVDYGRIPYTRAPSGEPVFGEPETLAAKVWPEEQMPGYRLLRSLVTGDNSIGQD